MSVRTSFIATMSFLATLAFIPQQAIGQTDQQCSLETITQSLNSLGCVVPGAYISADSVVASITNTCAPTADAEVCHACFRKGGAKVGPALKGLVKAKMLSKVTLSQFRVALVTAEEATCAPKETEETTPEDSGDEYSQPTNAGGIEDKPRDQPRGRGQDDSAGARTERPERRQRPERLL